MLSLMMQSPARRRLSQGICDRDGSETSYTSPGTSSLERAERPTSCQGNSCCYFRRNTHKNRYGAHERRIRSVRFPSNVAWSRRVSLNAFEATQGTHGTSFDDGGRDGEDRYQKDSSRIVIVLIHRPEDETGDLKDVKRMESLPRY